MGTTEYQGWWADLPRPLWFKACIKFDTWRKFEPPILLTVIDAAMSCHVRPWAKLHNHELSEVRYEPPMIYVGLVRFLFVALGCNSDQDKLMIKIFAGPKVLKVASERWKSRALGSQILAHGAPKAPQLNYASVKVDMNIPVRSPICWNWAHLIFTIGTSSSWRSNEKIGGTIPGQKSFCSQAKKTFTLAELNLLWQLLAADVAPGSHGSQSRSGSNAGPCRRPHRPRDHPGDPEKCGHGSCMINACCIIL